MDQMLLDTDFIKAAVSTFLCRCLRKKGINADISIVKLNVTRTDEEKKLKISLAAEGSLSDEELMKIIIG